MLCVNSMVYTHLRPDNLCTNTSVTYILTSWKKYVWKHSPGNLLSPCVELLTRKKSSKYTNMRSNFGGLVAMDLFYVKLILKWTNGLSYRTF